jgi:hypothetical protein
LYRHIIGKSILLLHVPNVTFEYHFGVHPKATTSLRLSQNSRSYEGLMRPTFATRIDEEFQLAAMRADKSGDLRPNGSYAGQSGRSQRAIEAAAVG